MHVLILSKNNCVAHRSFLQVISILSLRCSKQSLSPSAFGLTQKLFSFCLVLSQFITFSLHFIKPENGLIRCNAF